MNSTRVFVFTVCLASIRCGGGPIETAGTWTSNFGTEETITDEAWGAASLIEYDNDLNWAVTQNAGDDQYNPSKYNRLVWTEPNAGRFYYCTVDYGLETLAQAESSTQAADASDPASGGCGGFSWTELSRN